MLPDSPLELAKLIKNTKCVILKFSAGWCGPCKTPEFVNNYGLLKKEFSKFNNIKFIEFDVDEDSELVNSTKYYDFKI